jgi:hypothetical protein
MSEGMTPAEATRVALEARKGPVFFTDLRAHLERDAVFIVRANLDLIDCGVGVATDDVDNVKAWIRDGRLRKPSAKERTSWPEETTRRWMAVIVQPFVLVQEALDADLQPVSE